MTKFGRLSEPIALELRKQDNPMVEGHIPKTISVLCDLQFELEVLCHLLKHVFPETDIRCFETPAAWSAATASDPTSEVLLYSLGDRLITKDEVKSDLRDFIAKADGRRVIVTSHSDDTMSVFEAIDCGAASFISANAGLDELLEAISADFTKSVIIPRASLAALRAAIPVNPPSKPGLERYFTERQLDVAQALQRGAANKIIAYELGLCESTVKVHIRNIMRKLGATNRTQAAYKLNELAHGNIDLDPDVADT